MRVTGERTGGAYGWRAVICAAVLTFSAASLSAKEKARPNIIFILADDLGYGDVGYNAQAATNVLARLRTPHLDRLAREGVVLTAHYAAAPVSAPSRASLMTGRVQGACSLRDNCFDRPFAETNTLASVLKGVGYVTWAVGKWGIAGGGESGTPVTSHPLDRGFDYFYGFLDHLAGHTYYHYKGHTRNAFMGITENRTDATDSATGIYSTDLFTAKAKQLIGSHVATRPEVPFFLYLAVNTIHGSGLCDDTLQTKARLHVPGRPYPESGVTWPLEPEPLAARNTWIEPAYRDLPSPAARYATAISRLDHALGDLARELERLGIARETMVVFTSDNGPADEYGADPRNFASNAPFDGFKRDVFEGGMRVPAFVRWPARIAAGSLDNAPSQFHDWMATLAAAGGAAKPAESEGVSLLPRFGAAAGPATPSLVYTQYNFPWAGNTAAFQAFAARKGAVRGLQQMVRVGDYVALRTRMKPGESTPVRLYDVVRDPFETTDLSSRPEHQARLKELTAILDTRLRP
ncbi:MAG: sulfatase-like hydrolase/transferase [Kiritimatiellae bacterium]|nr:sulfatase-like hydrolase/transferase [Kiritimatiellia bacterium]